jgi:hypothetical protein
MSTFNKFASESVTGNTYGIVNDDGQIVTLDYLRRYIHCWCRVSDGFTTNRKANIAYFMSAEFLSAHKGMTASQIGHAASLDARWDRHVDPSAKPTRTAKQPAVKQPYHFDGAVLVVDDEPTFKVLVTAYRKQHAAAKQTADK